MFLSVLVGKQSELMMRWENWPEMGGFSNDDKHFVLFAIVEAVGQPDFSSRRQRPGGGARREAD